MQPHREWGAPVGTLVLFLFLGAIALARGHTWGVLALKDSVANFYAPALLVPVALFSSLARERRPEQRTFTGLEVAPLITLDQPGRQFVLQAEYSVN